MDNKDKIQDLIQVAGREEADIPSLLETAFVRGQIDGLRRGKELAQEALVEMSNNTFSE